MKIAVLGGTFNPLHNGHVMIAREACERLGYDRVLFVPAFLPPHKRVSSKETAFDRLEMVEAFCKEEGSGRFLCEPCEIEREGVSYTCDTLEYISEKYKNEIKGKPAFILGEEAAAEFHKWRNPERIAETADLIVARRKPGDLISGLSQNKANVPSGNFTGDFSASFNPETFGYPFIELQNPEMRLSSSEIRVLIENGGDWEKLVPKAVAEYIKQKKLYMED